MTSWLLSRSLGSLVAALALAAPQNAPAPAPKPGDPDPAQKAPSEGEARVDPDLKEEGLLRERIPLDEPRAAELRLRFTKVTQQLRRNVIRLTVERRVGS